MTLKEQPFRHGKSILSAHNRAHKCGLRLSAGENGTSPSQAGYCALHQVLAVICQRGDG